MIGEFRGIICCCKTRNFTMLFGRIYPLYFSSTVSIVPKGILLENDLAFTSKNEKKNSNCKCNFINHLNHLKDERK